ncbi:hypothetical protein HYFRA_00012882 [Hymenoscyphus fraxineus]|uniref:Peroxidase n=1 Tax=Hymenoscyphus fraxineus TaxID=746836 RepID=A0A9N9L299_9HELO|nr:hypothetical protein HYFRA_00012882 [Hymenoscyphus fraxineus]
MAIFRLRKLLAFSAFIPAILAAQVGNTDPMKNQGLLGDLVGMPVSNLTNAGSLLRDWLLHSGSAIGPDNPEPQPDCATDVCCPWYAVSKELSTLFVNSTTKECTDDARAAVRLGFHDAASWSKKSSAAGIDIGGADGSFIIFREENRPENNGLQDFVAKLVDIHSRNPGVGAADLIQFAAHHGIVSCPQGPRIVFFAGRKDATVPAPTGLVPDVHDSAQNLIDLMMDKTINAQDLAALLGAHSTAKQFHIDEAQSGAPQDSTPGIWDVKFYNETLQANATSGVFRIPSDLALSQAQNMSEPWKAFVGAQQFWNQEFALAYTRIGLLGVNNINDLIDCTNALPAHIPEVKGAIGGQRRRRNFYH